MGFKNPQDMPFLVGKKIQEEQKNRHISNPDLANLVGISTRTLMRIKSGSSCRLETIENILFELGLELTAQPIGYDFKEEVKNGKY